MNRREFLVRGAVAASAAAGAGCASSGGVDRRLHERSESRLSDWSVVRSSFDLDPTLAHFAGFFLVSHPRSVRDAIERFRRELDANPIGAIHGHLHMGRARENEVRLAAGEYLGVDGEREIALTDSTTMGLGLVYNGFRLKAGQEILTTTHDHYATRCSLGFRAARTRCTLRQITLYEDGAQADAGRMVETIRGAITPTTRLVALTWVHSSSGVKLPIRAISDAITEINRKEGCGEDDRALLAVDGVHGLGIENVTLPELGCDFFIAGTHKWVLSPRGTGIVWAKPAAWAAVDPIIPPFGPHDHPSTLFTPGGFHSFEHRWAAGEGFKFHMRIGKQRVQARIHALNRQIREGLAAMSKVKLHTPLSNDLSSGIVCFDVEGRTPEEVVAHLASRRIVGSVSPYEPPCARLAAGVFNTEEEVERALGAVREIA